MNPFPPHVEIELTNKCNLKCIMCPHSFMKREQGYMDYDLFLKITDECRGKVSIMLLHQIGEPLMHPACEVFIMNASNAGIRTHISTNAMLLTRQRCTELLASGLSEIMFCIDSLKETVFEKIRVGAFFHKVMKNVLRFVEMHAAEKSKMKIIVQMIEMEENQYERELFRLFWERFSNVEVLIKPFSTFAGAIPKEHIPSRKIKCYKPNECVTVQWNGDVVVCCRDYSGISKMGNIQNQTIEEIWHSIDYQYFRKLYKLSDLCRRC